MNKQKSTALHLAPNGALAEHSAGQSLFQFIERLLGKRSPAPSSAAQAATVKPGEEAQAVLQAYACASEQEAIELCQSLVSRGHAAAVQYDVYDYSWSVEVSPAAPGAQ